MVHLLIQQLEIAAEEALDDYLNLEDFKASTGIPWAHEF